MVCAHASPDPRGPFESGSPATRIIVTAGSRQGAHDYRPLVGRTRRQLIGRLFWAKSERGRPSAAASND